MGRWPVDGDPRIASPYLDPRRSPAHYGVDLAGKLGDPVRAPEAMTVVDVRSVASPEVPDNTNVLPAPWTGYGPGIVVGKGASGSFHLLAHLRATSVVRGQAVPEGGLLGVMASHVGASGSHTHWEVRDVAVDQGPATRDQHTMDPHVWLDAHGGGDPVPAPSSTRNQLGIFLVLLWLVRRRR